MRVMLDSAKMIASKIVFLFVAHLLFCGGNGDCTSIIVEKGQATYLDCQFQNNVQSVTWQQVSSTGLVNLTTCDLLGTCTRRGSLVYTGQVVTTSGVTKARLNIASASIDQNKFRCVDNKGIVVETCTLEVYAWPMTPTCSLKTLVNYTEVTCLTSDVYPDVRATLFDRQNSAMPTGTGRNDGACSRSFFGSGVKGDYEATCTWMVSYSTMLETTAFYVEMRALVSNYTLVNRQAAVSSDIPVVHDIPDVVIRHINCPVGPEVFRGRIAIDSFATCKCEVQQNGIITGQARWYTRQGTIVGTENPYDKSSTLTVFYNTIDPDQEYECRAINPTSRYFSVKYIPLFSYPDCYEIIEKGQSAYIQLDVSRSVSSITWQVFNGHGYTNLTTCSPNVPCPILNNGCLVGTNTLCANPMSPIYQGSASSGPELTSYTIRLDVNYARVNETDFRCVSNDRKVIAGCTYEVYAWPTQPVCQPASIDSTHTFVEVTCAVSDVFPEIRASLHAVMTNPTHVVSDANNSICEVSDLGDGLFGDVSETCTWRFPIASLRPGVYYFSIQVRANISDYTTVARAPAESQTFTFDMKLPVATIKDCPAGPGVNKGRITIGTQATCRCDLDPVGFPPGQARWYTSSGFSVGPSVEDQSNGSSTLTVEYQSSVPHQSYECRAVTSLPGTPNPVPFTPLFVSSAPGQVFIPQSGHVFFPTVILVLYLCYHDVTN